MVTACVCVAHDGEPCQGAEAPNAQRRLARMQQAVRVLIEGLSEDCEREGLRETPRRVAQAWLDMAGSSSTECKRAFGNALFHEPVVSAGPDGIVLVRDITFASISKETLLPFHGRCHIAYVPCGGVVLGLSKLARVTKCLAARVQSQLEFTQTLLAAVQREVAPKGVAVLVQASHLGLDVGPQSQLTDAVCGCFQDSHSGLLDELHILMQLNREREAQGCLASSHLGYRLPAHQYAAAAACSETSKSMLAAAASLLEAVGEDPAQPDLAASCLQYVQWLLGATAGYHMQLPCLAALRPSSAVPSSISDTSSDDSTMEHTCVEGCCSASMQMDSAAEIAKLVQPHHQGATAAVVFSTRFTSQCEHHLLPFYGELHLAYEPDALSKNGKHSREQEDAALVHIVEMFSRRLQVQERLTNQVAEAALSVLNARSVLVIVRSAHMCMVARGVEEHASSTLTTAIRGCWSADSAARAEALTLLMPPPMQQL